MSLKTIRLELARSKESPAGDSGHAYEFRAPLDTAGALDREAWLQNSQLCTVRRLKDGRAIESGLLQHHRGNRWVFSYAVGTDDDEPIFKFSSHTFKEGEYVTVTEHDGVARTFRVASVEDWHPTK